MYGRQPVPSVSVTLLELNRYDNNVLANMNNQNWLFEEKKKRKGLNSIVSARARSKIMMMMIQISMYRVSVYVCVCVRSCEVLYSK